jgi:hypothetical protein
MERGERREKSGRGRKNDTHTHTQHKQTNKQDKYKQTDNVIIKSEGSNYSIA